MTLYERLGGYDAIVATVNDFLPRVIADEALGRFWAHRGDDGFAREKQLLIDFLSHNSGGPMYYTGRSMALTHRGMRISDSDWTRLIGHLSATLDALAVPGPEREEVLGFVGSLKSEIVEV